MRASKGLSFTTIAIILIAIVFLGPKLMDSFGSSNSSGKTESLSTSVDATPVSVSCNLTGGTNGRWENTQVDGEWKMCFKEGTTTQSAQVEVTTPEVSASASTQEPVVCGLAWFAQVGSNTFAKTPAGTYRLVVEDGQLKAWSEEAAPEGTTFPLNVVMIGKITIFANTNEMIVGGVSSPLTLPGLCQ